MENSSAPAGPTGDERPSFLLRHQFLIYRLFSLSGLVPVGAYLVVHLLTNASVVNGPMTFQEQVDRIHSLGVVLPLVEWTFIFIPILFHATVGWLIISGAAQRGFVPVRQQPALYGPARDRHHRVCVHRVSRDPVASLLRRLFKDWGGAEFDPEHATSSTAIALRRCGSQILYAIGMLSCVYHFANGLWTQGITWGLWTSAAAQRRASYVSVVVGLALAVVGMSALLGMRGSISRRRRRSKTRCRPNAKPC